MRNCRIFKRIGRTGTRGGCPHATQHASCRQARRRLAAFRKRFLLRNVDTAKSLSHRWHPAAKLLAAWDGTMPRGRDEADSAPDEQYPLGRVQCRLSPEAAAELVEAYRQGGGIDDLARQFEVHRTTVMAHLDRSGVERRRRGLAREQVDEAAKLYGDGWSLARVGRHFGVNGETVRVAFQVGPEVPRREPQRRYVQCL